MQSRLDSIDRHLAFGYVLKKDLGAFPVFVGSDQRSHYISSFNSPAGFSWVGFFFPFAVCTQIREWSFFCFSAILFAACSVISIVSGFDPTFGATIALSLMYGIYFPYLRYMALARDVEEISVGSSIALGVLLSAVASTPSILIDIAAYYANN
jgi:hypothetical protein